MCERSDEDLAIGDGWRRVTSFAKFVFRNQFEPFGIRLEHDRHPILIRDIKVAPGGNDRAPIGPTSSTFGPQDVAGQRINALDRARAGVWLENVITDKDARTDTLGVLFHSPDAIRFGYVAAAADSEAN